MTRKEQVKILDVKIEANNAQYNLDRMNAEISAYSSGDLPKYEYLTKKYLNYKPNAFEQAKFEYSPLGKVFIDGLDKSDRKEGLLKKLKNIEDKSNSQLLALRDINRPAIRGRNGDDDDDDDEYKKIQNFKKELIDDNILHKNGSKKFDNIINKWNETKDKNIVYINTKNKLDTRKFDIYNVFYGYLNKNVDYKDIEGIIDNIKRAVKLYQKDRSEYSDKNKSIINNSNKTIKGMELIKSLIGNDELRILGEYYAKPLHSTNLSWMKDEEGYEETAEEAGSDYMKRNNDTELKLIKDFLTKINNGKINNKDTAASEFRKLKQKVKNDRLKQDLIRNLEKYLFGEDIEPEEKYEKSIAERVKTKRDTQKTFAPSSPPKEDYSAETDEYLKYLEEEEKDRKKFSDEYDSSRSGLNKKGKGSVVSRAKGERLKILTNKQMLNRLPILLAQIQAGNNSNKLKNELRQIIYSLYRSKVLTKTVYNNLIKVTVRAEH